MKKLTPKQEKFCQKYLECGNASEAYRFAYNAGNMKPETINRKATELMADGTITARLDELRARAERKFEITRDRILQEVVSIALAPISDVISARDKIAAITAINKMQGYNAPEKIAETDSYGNDLNKPLSAERTQEILAELSPEHKAALMALSRASFAR